MSEFTVKFNRYASDIVVPNIIASVLKYNELLKFSLILYLRYEAITIIRIIIEKTPYKTFGFVLLFASVLRLTPAFFNISVTSEYIADCFG